MDQSATYLDVTITENMNRTAVYFDITITENIDKYTACFDIIITENMNLIGTYVLISFLRRFESPHLRMHTM